MAFSYNSYTLVIENKDATIKASPRFVRIDLNYSWLKHRGSWDIPKSEINNWIGINSGNVVYGMSSGVFKLGGYSVGLSRNTLFFYASGKKDDGYIMRLDNIDFHRDCSSKDGEAWKTGTGIYDSPYTKHIHVLEWSNRNIIPEP